jgi:fructokinase
MIAVLGETLVDRFEAGDGSPAIERTGGSPANVAVALARLGVATRLVTQLGDDTRGRAVLRYLHDSGVLVTAGSVHGGRRTGVARTTIIDGQPSYDFTAWWDKLSPAANRAVLDDHIRCLHTGSIAALAPAGSGAGTVQRAAAAARRRATITFDPNCRPSVMGDAHAGRRRAEGLVALSDVVKASEDDVRWLYGDRPVTAVAARWLDLGALLVIVTRGRRGSSAVTARTEVTVPAPAVDVVDTVGAGDSFMAGVLVGLDRAGVLGAAARPDLAALDGAAVEDLLRLGTQVAAITCGRQGADSPTASELAAITA